MKKTRSCFLVFIIVFAAQVTHAQAWVNVGSPGFSTIMTPYTYIAIDGSGTPYVAYINWASPYGPIVMKYNGSNWVTVGTPNFSARAAYCSSIAIDGSGTPYVAYEDLSPDSLGGPATVMKYNGSSWVNVGSPEFSAGWVNATSIAIDGSGTPYVVYQDNANSNKVTVMKYNGSSWVNVGTPGFSAGQAVGYNWIAIDGSGTPYVVYTNYTIGSPYSVGDGPAIVMKYNGSSWVNVGAPGFSAGEAYFTSIAIDGSGTPYVVYSDSVNSYKATVMKYNGSSWVNVGSPGFSAGQADYTSIAINAAGTPYVAYQDCSIDKATVMKYNGSSWVDVGSPGFSAGGTESTSIAIDGSGTPYVVYSDSANNEQVTVMKFDTSTSSGVENIAIPSTTLNLFPAPNHGSFTLKVFSQQKEDATITITNILGEKVKELTTTTNTATQIQLNAPAGMYFVTAVTKNESVSGKMVVE